MVGIAVPQAVLQNGFKWVDESIGGDGDDQQDTRGQTTSHGDQSAYEQNTNLDKDNVDTDHTDVDGLTTDKNIAHSDVLMEVRQLL